MRTALRSDPLRPLFPYPTGAAGVAAGLAVATMIGLACRPALAVTPSYSPAPLAGATGYATSGAPGAGWTGCTQSGTNLTCPGSLGVAGALTVGGTATLSGTVTLQSGITVNGTAAVGQSLSVGQALTVGQSLTVTGETYGADLFLSGGVYHYSDRRLKHDVQVRDEGRKLLFSLPSLKTWTWNRDGRPGRGLIAQDVQAWDPAAVTLVQVKDGLSTPTLVINDSVVLADTVAAMGSLRTMVGSLRTMVAVLGLIAVVMAGIIARLLLVTHGLSRKVRLLRGSDAPSDGNESGRPLFP